MSTNYLLVRKYICVAVCVGGGGGGRRGSDPLDAS